MVDYLPSICKALVPQKRKEKKERMEGGKTEKKRKVNVHRQEKLINVLSFLSYQGKSRAFSPKQ
jgi:hypothetical protein